MNVFDIQIIRLDRLDVRHRTRSFFIWLNPRGEIYFSLKELIAMFAKVRFTTCKDARFVKSLPVKIPCYVAWLCIRPFSDE